jgi:hypothetical protein
MLEEDLFDSLSAFRIKSIGWTTGCTFFLDFTDLTDFEVEML